MKIGLIVAFVMLPITSVYLGFLLGSGNGFSNDIVSVVLTILGIIVEFFATILFIGILRRKKKKTIGHLNPILVIFK